MEELKDKRQREIMEAALKVFGESGFFQGKMEAIAKEAGIGKATIYEYFSSKAELFQSMLVYHVEEYIEGARKTISKEAAFKNRLKGLAEYNINYVSSHATTLMQVFARPENMSRDLLPPFFKLRAMICSFIAELIHYGIQTGELPSDIDIEVASLVIMGALNASIGIMGTLDGKTISNRFEASSKTVDILMYGLSYGNSQL